MNICTFLPHDWRYNFHYFANKRICARCGKKQMVSDFGNAHRDTSWTDTIFEFNRTDQELVDTWHKLK